MDSSPLRVFFQCTGVGTSNRGIESFFRDAFDGLKHTPGLEAQLIKGTGAPLPDEHVPFFLSRYGWPAKSIGLLAGRNSYVVEQWSSYFAIVSLIKKHRPHIVFYSDANIGFLLYRMRQQIGVPFRLLFSNGGPTRAPFIRCDAVHQVAPLYLEEALSAGESPCKQFLVPYGIVMPEVLPTVSPVLQHELRARLGLPPNRPIVLSVGWVAREHKRMHYVIEEVAQMPEPRPFLQLLGHIDAASPEIIEMGNQLLGPLNFAARSVPYENVAEYYQAADCFVLGSVKEGFGRVYLESLMHGLPTIGHRHPVIEYVLGDAGIVADLTLPGELCRILIDTLRIPPTDSEKRFRWQSVRDRFGWKLLADAYIDMFRLAAKVPL